MKITTFRNMKGLIHGSNPMRISCDKEGVLKIGEIELHIVADAETPVPTLFNGGTGDYEATFTDTTGDVYDLDKVAIRGGRIAHPSPLVMELMEMRMRADAADSEFERMREELEELKNIFDTNSLNFLIN